MSTTSVLCIQVNEEIQLRLLEERHLRGCTKGSEKVFPIVQFLLAS
jgi:hypothetical protein